MALPKQVIEVHFDKGLNTKLNPKLLPPGQLVTLDDCCFDDSNTIKRRDGYTLGTITLSSGATLGSAFMGFTLGSALGQIDTAGLAALYSETLGRWVRSDAVALTHIDRTQIIRNSASQTAPDVAAFNSTELWAWEDSRGGVRASSIDTTTGVTIMYDAVVDASGSRPRCIAVLDQLYVFYLSGSNLKVSQLDHASRGFISGTTTLKTDVHTTCKTLDVVYNATSGVVQIVYQNNSGGSNALTVCTWNTSSITATQTINSGSTVSGVNINLFSGGALAVIWSYIEGEAVKAVVATSGLTFGSPITIATSFADCGVVTSAKTGSNLLVVFGGTTNIITATISTTTVTTAAARLTNDLMPCSRPFTLNGGLAVAALHSSDVQPTLFVVGVSGSYAGDVLARSMYSRAGDPFTADTTNGVVSPSSVVGDGTSSLEIPAVERGRIQFSNGQDVTPVGVSRLVCSAISQTDRCSAELNSVSFFPGGCPMLFDGTGFIEAGYHRFPFDLQVSASGSGGQLADGTYEYLAVEEWVDAKGNLHRGIPSVPVSVSASATNSATVTLNCVGQTRRSSNLPNASTDSFIARSNSKIVIYRTTVNAPAFYKLTQVLSSNTDNVTNASSTIISITDSSTSDLDIQANEVLYTQGGALENEPPPACRYVCVHQKRWFVAGIDGDPYAFSYSQEAVLGEVPGFSEALQGRVPADLGKITGLASMDDRLFLLCEHGIWGISGQGPDSTGGNNGYSEPQKVSADTGCSSARSIVETPDGLMFLGPRGIRLLSRTLSIVPVGAPVDSLATGCVAALLDQTKNQVRFYTGSYVLVYDLLWQQWSRYTNHFAVDAANYKGLPIHIDSTGAVATPGGTTDNGAAITVALETGWLNFGAVQAIQRVWRALILGKNTLAQTINLAVGYDYESAYTDSVSVTEPTTAPVQVPVDGSTVRVFRFDEASGAIVDAVGGSSIPVSGTVNTGTGQISGCRVWPASSTGVFTNVGGTYYANDYSAMQTQTRTVEAWIKPASSGWNDDPTAHVIICSGAFTPSIYAGLLYYLEIATGSRSLRFLYEKGTAGAGVVQSVDSGVAVTLDIWTHVAVVFDGGAGTCSFYFNGVLGARFTGLAAATVGASGGAGIMVGRNPGISEWWRGSMDDLRVSNVARSASEIFSTYQNGAGAFERAMQFRHHLTRQKCEALRLKLTSSGTAGAVGFASMAFEVGGKKGGFKLPGSGTI